MYVSTSIEVKGGLTSLQELTSLAKQIELVYVANQRAPRPFQLHLTGLKTGGRIHHALTTHISGFSNYQANTQKL